MKSNISSILLILFLSTSSYADVIDDDIATANSIDELVQKMTKANHQNRYRYMNAIKSQLALLKKETKAEKIENIMSDIQNNKAEQQRSLEQSHKNTQNGTNSSSGKGGNNNSAGGNGGGGRNQ